MVEAAVGLLVAYAGRKAAGLLGRAGSDADAAFDAKVGEWYAWVKERVTGRRAGRRVMEELENDPGRPGVAAAVSEQLADEVDADEEFAALLERWVARLEAARPESWTVNAPGASGPVIGRDVSIHAEGGSVAAWQVGEVNLGSAGDPSPPGRRIP